MTVESGVCNRLEHVWILKAEVGFCQRCCGCVFLPLPAKACLWGTRVPYSVVTTHGFCLANLSHP